MTEIQLSRRSVEKHTGSVETGDDRARHNFAQGHATIIERRINYTTEFANPLSYEVRGIRARTSGIRYTARNLLDTNDPNISTAKYSRTREHLDKSNRISSLASHRTRILSWNFFLSVSLSLGSRKIYDRRVIEARYVNETRIIIISCSSRRIIWKKWLTTQSCQQNFYRYCKSEN